MRSYSFFLLRMTTRSRSGTWGPVNVWWRWRRTTAWSPAWSSHLTIQQCTGKESLQQSIGKESLQQCTGKESYQHCLVCHCQEQTTCHWCNVCRCFCSGGRDRIVSVWDVGELKVTKAIPVFEVSTYKKYILTDFVYYSLNWEIKYPHIICVDFSCNSFHNLISLMRKPIKEIKKFLFTGKKRPKY